MVHRCMFCDKNMGRMMFIRWMALLVGVAAVGATLACTDPVTQTCTNCGPGPACNASYDDGIPALRPNTCKTVCENDTMCTGSWFHFAPGQSGQCDLYECSQLQQYFGGTFHRRTCVNDSECLSYQIYRYENMQADCQHENSSMSMFNSSDEYECLEECLDTENCRSITFDETNGYCTLHNCTQSISSIDSIFYKRECVETCQSETLQICTNCGPSSSCPASYRNVTMLVPSAECGEECDSSQDCGTSYYDMASQSCSLYDCQQIAMKSSVVSFRKTCYSECSNYEIWKLDNATGNCTAFYSETYGTSAEICLHRCLEMANCMSVSFDQVDSTCLYFNCTDYATEPNYVFYWRKCLEQCERIYTQTCTDCESMAGCNPMVQHSAYSKVDCDNLCNSTDSCFMAVFKPLDDTCYLYECTALQYSFGNTALRHTCSDDCLNYNIEIHYYGAFLCSSFDIDVGGVELPYCMSKCLDMTGCRGFTYSHLTQSCQYYNCTDVDLTSGVILVRRLCISEELSRDYTQECLNCGIASNVCPHYVDKPSFFIDKNCNEACNITEGCTTAIFDYGQCYHYDCIYVTQEYGVNAYRRTFNPECLQFKIFIKANHIGTCPVLQVVMDSQGYEYCLAGCLDYDGCMGATYMPENETCLFHSCDESNSTSQSVGMTFVQRLCDLDTCVPLFEQECVNCNIHDGVNKAFSVRSMISLTSNCSETCSSTIPCGASVYDPSSSKCRLYNHTGLRIQWGKTALRKSCRQDCPKFKLTELQNMTSIGDVLSIKSDIPRLDDCVHLCLDTTGCFSVTYYETILTCVLHDHENWTDISAPVSTMFVFLACQLEECNKDFTQVCMNCIPGPNCQTYMYEEKFVSFDFSCEWACNDTNCLASYFEMSDAECQIFNCGQVKGFKRFNRVYRKSCANDCPIFEIYTSSNTSGFNCSDIGDTGLDSIPSIHYCVEMCLDIPNCRSVTYSQSKNKCTFHSGCTSTNYIDKHDYSRRVCMSDDPPPGSLIQICHNCGIGDDCQTHFSLDNLNNIFFDYVCEDVCLNNTNCYALQFSTHYSSCLPYQCSQVKQRIGQTVYRRTNNTDCLEFELFKHHGHAGNCSVLGSYGAATTAEYCMEICLETEYCRGTSYHTTSDRCLLHSCTDMVEDSAYVFIERVCSEDFDVCNRTHVQTCLDCSKGPTCSRSFDRVTEYMPRNINYSLVGVNMDYKQVWFWASRNKAYDVYCSEVDMAVGDIVHRATCIDDCPTFEIFIHTMTIGNCSSPISTLTGGLTLHYCISKCLDMDGCRMLNHDNVGLSCEFYTDCDNYTAHANYTYFRRVCIDESEACVANTTQTCLNCGISSTCPGPFDYAPNSNFLGDCLDMKISDLNSDTVWYDKQGNQCNFYQCSYMEFSINNIAYRDSCDPDCEKYELFQKDDFVGTCDVIGEDAGSVTLPYCIQHCLDMTGCGGVSFYGNSTTCYYHDCANNTQLHYGNTTFIQRRCITDECLRNYTQLCLNCGPSESCQSAFTYFSNITTFEECYNITLDLQDAGLVGYYEKSGDCWATNCSLVNQTQEMLVLRKSCSSDCPVFRIAYLHGYNGTCPIIGSDEGGVTMEYCLDKCLDMPGCEGITISAANSSQCTYHTCIDKETGSSTDQFVWRVCINDTVEDALDPVLPYHQKCLNCDSQCQLPISRETFVSRDTDCTTTCPECKMIQYLPPNETCSQFGCDSLYPPTKASRIMRRTSNPECQEFEVFYYTSRHPLCNVIAFQEGFYDFIYCVEQCLDTPGCLSALYSTDNCTLYDCNDHIASQSYNLFLEKICTNDTTHLLQSFIDCVDPGFQTCVNCNIDVNFCPLSYVADTGSGSVCKMKCAEDPTCEAAIYGANICSKYQCDIVVPRNDTDESLFRKICYVDDCPLFEVHRLSNHFGASNTLRIEELQFHPELCFERCLRISGCRAVTYWGRYSTCVYHSGDCSYAYTDTDGLEVTFMWRYCLYNASMSTFVSDTNQTFPPKEYLDCLSSTSTSTVPTTVSSVTTISTLSAVTVFTTLSITPGNVSFTTLSTTLSTTSLNVSPSIASVMPSTTIVTILFNASTSLMTPSTTQSNVSVNMSSVTTPVTTFLHSATTQSTSSVAVSQPTYIYIRSCLCSLGSFGNLTVEEVSQQLILNLTIDKDDTGAERRRHISAKDERTSAITIGSAGVAVIVFELSFLILMDSTRIVLLFKILRGLFQRV